MRCGMNFSGDILAGRALAKSGLFVRLTTWYVVPQRQCVFSLTMIFAQSRALSPHEMDLSG